MEEHECLEIVDVFQYSTLRQNAPGRQHCFTTGHSVTTRGMKAGKHDYCEFLRSSYDETDRAKKQKLNIYLSTPKENIGRQLFKINTHSRSWKLQSIHPRSTSRSEATRQPTYCRRESMPNQELGRKTAMTLTLKINMDLHII